MSEGHRTALGRARGLGSAKSGVGGFIAERVTGAALIPLGLWAAWSAVGLARADFTSASAWLHGPLNAALLALLAVVSSHHMQIGMRVVVEDCITRPVTKAALLVASAFICWAAAAVTLVSILIIVARP